MALHKLEGLKELELIRPLRWPSVFPSLSEIAQLNCLSSSNSSYGSSLLISLNDVIQYRDLIDNIVKKDGQVTWNGIICGCCTMVLSVSQFKVHAGFKKNRPCLNLFMESGEPFALCVLKAWSSEYKLRKSGRPNVQVDNKDPNDDSCGICGDGGELICCDNCPSTFHQACLLTEVCHVYVSHLLLWLVQ